VPVQGAGCRVQRLRRVPSAPAFLTSPAPTSAQNAVTVEALAHRLEIIEQQNPDLQEQLQSLRREVESLKRGAEGPSTAARIDSLEEKVDVQARRLGEHDQVKVEGSQRTSVRLTGMISLQAP